MRKLQVPNAFALEPRGELLIKEPHSWLEKKDEERRPSSQSYAEVVRHGLKGGRQTSKKPPIFSSADGDNADDKYDKSGGWWQKTNLTWKRHNPGAKNTW